MIIKKFFLLLLFLPLLFYSQKTIIIEGESAVNINQQSLYSTSNKNSINFNFSENLPILTDAPIATKNVSLFFELQNNNENDSLFYITSNDDVSEFYLFTKNNNKLLKIGGSGFSHFKTQLSVPGNSNAIAIVLKPHERKKYYLEVPKFDNELYLSEFYVQSEKEFLIANYKNSQSYFTILSYVFIGIHLCLFFFGFYKLKNKKFRKPLVYFLILNAVYIFYIFFNNENLILENTLFPDVPNIIYEKILGALEPALYYLFFWSYLTFNKKYHYFGVFLKYSGLYWLVYFIVRNVHFEYEWYVKFCNFIKDFATIYDLIITFLVFLYLLKFNSIFYKFARIGVFLLLISALQMSFPFIMGLLGFSETPYVISEFSYIFMGLMIVLDFLLFLYGINLDELQAVKEGQEYKNELLSKELEKQKELEHERERISSDMHDDIGARISAMKLHGEFIKENFSEDPKLKAELDELFKNTEEMTVSMREMIWSLKSQNDFLQNFISFAQQYATGFFAKSKAQIHFKNEIEENQHFNAEIRRNLFLCYKEALNNIYKHSQATEVYIIFSTKNSRLQLEISDNGIGFQPNENNQGNGMYNMKTRMTEISGDFETPKVEKGMLLRFSTPLELV